MDVEAYLLESAARVNALLEHALPDSSTPPVRLHAAMRHLLFPGGKRLRPAFAFAAAEAVGSSWSHALPMAAAVELVHVYSLIHDDLPCMDDDDERRGQPTVHVAFDEATAVLAGDALLAAAFETLINTGHTIPPDALMDAVRELAAASGSRGLVGGQADDLAVTGGRPASATAVESIHGRKAAALIAAAVVGGATLAGADERTRERLRAFGAATGVAFQITDDLLDGAQGDGCSLVDVLGTDGAQARAESLLADALERIEPLGDRAETLRELARFAVRRRR